MTTATFRTTAPANTSATMPADVPADTPAEWRPNGGWLDAPADLQPPLQGDISADVVVIGAGFAGLCAALELSARGARVVVLEREYAGFGASGRNAGYLAGSLGLEFELFVRKLGREQAARIVGFYDAGVDYVEGLLAQHGIDCDYNPSGLIRVGVHPAQHKRLQRAMLTGLELGSQTEFLDGAALRARGIPPAFLFGCATRRGGTLDPGKYVSGLRRAALQAGVRLFEQTALLSFSEGPTITVQTPNGRASAPHLLLATNAYTPQLGGLGKLGDRLLALRVSAIETEVLTEAQLAALGWPRREGLVTAHWTMESHRLTARNTLLVSTKRIACARDGRTPNEPDADAYRALRATLRERFPQLGDPGLRACWSGWISLAADALPVVGASGAQRNVHHAAGCAGHGLGSQSLIGRLIAQQLSGEAPPMLQALQHATPWLPPDPLRRWGVNATLALLNRSDERVNRQARALRR